jgi:hypothetical protein
MLAIGISSNSFYFLEKAYAYGNYDSINNNNHNQTLYFNNKYSAQQFVKDTQTNAISESKISAVNISSNEGRSEIPQEAMSGNKLYIAWIDDTSGNRDVFFRKSIDQGKTFGDTINLSNMSGGAYNLQIIARYNYVFVVWEHTPDNNGQIFFKRSVDNGNTFDKTISLGNNTGFYGLPQISAVSSNEKNNSNSINSRINIYTIWHDSSNGIVLRKSIDGGETFDKAISLSKKYSSSFYPQIAVSSANVYATWVSTQNLGTMNETNNIVFSRSTDAGNTFPNIINLSKNAKLSFDPQISISNNNVYVEWLNGTFLGKSFPLLRDILFKSSNDFGATFDDNTINLNNYTGGWAKDPKIKAFNNKVYATWIEKLPRKKNGEIYFRQSINNGKTFGDIINFSDNTKDSNSHQITLTQGNGNVYVIWVDDNYNKKLFNGSDISLRKITDNGNGNNSSIIDCTININNAIQYLPDSDKVVESSSDPQIVVLENNDKEEVNIVWHDDSSTNDEILFKSIPISDDNNNTTTKHTTGTTIHHTSYQHCQDNVVEEKKIIAAGFPERISNQTNEKFNGTTNIALVEPSFTNAAYDNSFYVFYALNANASDSQNITKYLNLLTSKVNKSPIIPGSTLLSLRKNIEWLMPNYNIALLTDVGVHNGSIFKDDNKLSNKFDVLILGHQEYVTQAEYNNLKRFVANGGVLILPYSNIFYSEVSYDKNSESVTLVKGHNWAFNDKSAWKNIKERWENETSQWVGSNYLCYSCNITFANNPFEYKHHEEQFITNPNVKILLDYNATISDNNVQDIKNNNSDMENNKDPTKISKNLHIAAYEHDYKKGKVIALGIYPNDALMEDDRFNRFFDSLLLKYTEGLRKKEPKTM